MDVIDREYRTVPHEDKLYSRLVMDTNVRRARLEANQRMRNEQAVRDLDWARWAVSIPELDYHYITRKHPELQSPDRQIRDKAWARWLASSESAPYRVR